MLLVVVVVAAVMVPGLVVLVVGVMFGGYDVGGGEDECFQPVRSFG